VSNWLSDLTGIFKPFGTGTGPPSGLLLTPASMPALDTVTFTLSDPNTLWLSTLPVFQWTGPPTLDLVWSTSQEILSDTSASLTVHAGLTVGTVIISDPSTSRSQLLMITPGGGFTANPTAILASRTTGVLLGNPYAHWLTDQPTFTVAGDPTADLGFSVSQVLTGDTTATLWLTLGVTPGELTVTDPGAGLSVTIEAIPDPTALRINPGRVFPDSTRILTLSCATAFWLTSPPVLEFTGDPTADSDWSVSWSVTSDTQILATVTAGATKGVVTITDSSPAALAAEFTVGSRPSFAWLWRRRK
jgi:hypothetical protein